MLLLIVKKNIFLINIKDIALTLSKVYSEFNLFVVWTNRMI